MARYQTVLAVTAPPEHVFAYVADLSNALRWDPAVVEATPLEGGPPEVGIGSRFALVAVFYGRRIELEYEVIEYVAPTRVVHQGRARSVQSTRVFDVAPDPVGTSVTYQHEVRLTGALRLFDRGLQLPFTSMGDRARSLLANDLGG